MFGGVWKWAGKMRTTQTTPGIPPYKITIALQLLVEDVLFWLSKESEIDLIEQAARIHHQLVYIHPFQNGNGRFSRLVSDCFLKGVNLPFPIWPSALNCNGNRRDTFINSLKEADRGCYAQLIAFMKECSV